MTLENTELDKVFHDFLTLKKIRRTGWQLRGIKDGESLADHCFGVVLLTHILAALASTKLDRQKAVSMAIVHELGECRVGDIPYTALKYFPDKSSMEEEAVTDIMQPVGAELQQETLALFKEFEDGNTVEARFVRAIDKLDMMITAAEYEKAGYSGLTDFWQNESTFRAFAEFDELAKYAQYLKDTRKQRLNPTE